jgi:glutathione reductase (NADPH)
VRLAVDVQLASEVTRIVRSGNAFRVIVRTAGEEKVAECDLAVHAAGRTPNLKELNLDVGRCSV